VIDASYHAVSSGMFASCLQTLKKTFEEWKGGNSRTRVGFITFDSTLSYYVLQVFVWDFILLVFCFVLFETEIEKKENEIINLLNNQINKQNKTKQNKTKQNKTKQVK